MAAFAFALPILPGQEEAVKRMGEVVSGELRKEYEESRERLGISKEKVWIQRTPIGQAMIVYWETEDPQRTLRQLADSQDEVDNKFRQMVKNAAPAIDLSKENPLSYDCFSSGNNLELSRRTNAGSPVSGNNPSRPLGEWR